MADIRLTPMPQLGQDKAGTVTDRAQAQRIDHSVRLASGQAPTGELDSLLQGLSKFNSALGQYTDQTIEIEGKKKIAHAERAAGAAAAAADASTPEAVQKAVAADLPAGVPAAVDGYYRQVLGALLVDRHAVKAKSDWAAAYEEARKDPAFDPEQFIAAQRQKTLAGLTDAGLAGRMGTHLNEMEGSARVAAERLRLQRVDELTETGIHSSMQENMRADMTPEQIAGQYFKFQPMWEALGKSKKELAQRLFSRVNTLSEQMGGNPELFEVFSQVDPTTKQSLLSLNPELQAHVDAARERAKSKNLQMQVEANASHNMLTLDQLTTKAEAGALDENDILRNFGKTLAVTSPEQGAALLHKSRTAREKLLGDQEALAAFDTGILGRYKPEEQKKVLEAKLGPVINAAWEAARKGDANAMASLGITLMSEQSRSRSTENVAALERLIQTSVSTTQNPEGPTPEFQAMAALYRGLSADPKFRERYFKDDPDQLMREYLRSVDNGSDPAAAYKAAYQATSPAAKEAAEKFTKTPDFAKKLKNATDAVQGVGFMQRWFGLGMEPGNKLQVQTAAMDETRAFMARTPYADEKRVKEHLDSWVSQNFILDRTTGSAIRVPAGQAAPEMQDALTEYSKRVTEQYRLGDRNDGEWSVQYRPLGDGTVTAVVLTNGAAEQNLGTVPLAALKQAMVAEKSTTPQDREVLRTMQEQYRSGKLDLPYLAANGPVLEKARRLDLLPHDTLQAIEKARLAQAKEMVDSIPKLAMPMSTLENLAVNPKRAVKVDNKLTAQVAQQVLGTGGHMGLAASLTTMGEAVVLRASPDPAQGAGNNIGMGYNLKANAKTYASDLHRAGVPADMVEAVARGDAQLTPTQAQKLLLVALPRYEKQAETAANETAPGLWNRMTPQQRAVMIDVSWQAGDPSKFRKAWRALAAGDAAGFAEETKVFFTNKAGERVEDKRRGQLRAAMLNGDGAWMSTIQKYGSFPSTAMDAHALNNP